MVPPVGDTRETAALDASVPHSDRQDIADYVAEMATELRSIAAAAGLDLVAYLLEMAQHEADIIARTAGGRSLDAP